MATLIENANPKHNPVTTVVGAIFLVIGVVMFIMKWILPAFIVYKAELPYEWYTPIIPVIIGLILLFMTDEYFAKIFNRADKIIEKKTDTEGK